MRLTPHSQQPLDQVVADGLRHWSPSRVLGPGSAAPRRRYQALYGAGALACPRRELPPAGRSRAPSSWPRTRGAPGTSISRATRARADHLRLRVGPSLEDGQRNLFPASLKMCHGDKRRAAGVLGVSLETLYDRTSTATRRSRTRRSTRRASTPERAARTRAGAAGNRQRSRDRRFAPILTALEASRPLPEEAASRYSEVPAANPSNRSNRSKVSLMHPAPRSPAPLRRAGSRAR